MKFTVSFFILFISYAISLHSKAPLVMPEMFGAQHMDIHRNKVYIANNNHVFIYSLSGKKVKQFGKRGEGPGEFMFEPDFSIRSGQLVFEDKRNKLLFSDLDGTFIKEIKLPSVAKNIIPVSSGFIGIKRVFNRERKTYERQLVLFDNNFKAQKIVDRFFEEKRKKMKKKVVFNLLHHRYAIAEYNNIIYVGNTQKGMDIALYNLNGGHIKTIKVPHKKRVAGKAYINAFIEKQKRGKSWRQTKSLFHLVCEDHYPAYMFMRVEGGHIYLIAFPEQIEGKVHKITILNLKGELLGIKTVKIGFPWCIRNQKIYSVITNESDESQLKIDELNF